MQTSYICFNLQPGCQADLDSYLYQLLLAGCERVNHELVQVFDVAAGCKTTGYEAAAQRLIAELDAIVQLRALPSDIYLYTQLSPDTVR
jgi:hypothetical protein